MDTPTSGDINVISDEAFEPVISSEIDTFVSLYKNAKVKAKYLSEVDAVNAFLNDSSRVLFLSRELSKKEIDHLTATGFGYKVQKIAVEAVTFIVNRNNPDSLLSFEQIKNVITGNYTKWNQISKKNTNGDIKIIYDSKGSCNVRYFQDIFGTSNISKNSYAETSNKSVIEFVKKNKDAIGLIGLNWVSDKDNPNSMLFRKDVRVAEVSPADTSSVPIDYYKPYQAWIAKKYYPFRRYIYAIRKEPYNGLGAGLVAFVLSQPGQNIVLKEGLLPTRGTIRMVEVHNENINIVK